MTTPKVTLILKGLLAIFVNEGETECTVGMLNSSPPHHDRRISIKNALIEDTPLEVILKPPQIKSKLRLEVENVSQTKITFYEKNAPINRQAQPKGEKLPFRWVVDLEHPELYGRAIGAKKNGFTPLLTFKKGELFTKSVSLGSLFTQTGVFVLEDFGYVANVIGVEVSLDQADSKAVFYNGGDAYPLADPYKVEIFHDIPDDKPHPPLVTDANHYYKAVGLGLSEAERILFMSRSESNIAPAGPEAACFSAYFSKSQLLD